MEELSPIASVNEDADEFDFSALKVQAIKVNYYYVCKRKLWLFDKGISMERESDAVLEGKVLHQSAYPQEENREVMVDDLLKIDIMDDGYIRDIKKSSKMQKCDIMQIAYYLFYLKQMGVEKRGTINYVKERRIEEIELNDELEAEIENALLNIRDILKLSRPPYREKLPYCKKCAYYAFCYIGEIDDEA